MFIYVEESVKQNQSIYTHKGVTQGGEPRVRLKKKRKREENLCLNLIDGNDLTLTHQKGLMGNCEFELEIGISNGMKRCDAALALQFVLKLAR